MSQNRSHSKQFPVSGKKTPVNSGIFSNSGNKQKADSLPKPSYGKKADKECVRQAVDSNNIKVGMTHTKAAKTASAVAKYAK